MGKYLRGKGEGAFKTKEEKRRKDRDLLETVEEVFDKFTLEALYKLINRKVIDVIHGVVSTGKESRVYWAKSPDGEDLAVKIFLTSTREFKKTFSQYIEGDVRFNKKVRRATRPLIYAWALKEYKNLVKAYNVGVSVPKPIDVYKNVVVMSFIGDNGSPAPLLKDVDHVNFGSVFEKVIKSLKLLYCKAKLIHADLSEYNIMVWRDEPILFDFGQAVLVSHPSSQMFLERDVKNVVNFFRRKGVNATVEDVLNEVLGC